ncbi:MAG TPA: lipopolysaccharide heptosyltransferase II [Campylobacterales bacterium]|nr:lipopolysaccharide heptosyltransferase II [Campylobacterales bacterium]
MKKIFIEIPTWLGDAIMTTPAIQNIVKLYPDIKITLFGSNISLTALKYHPNVEQIVIDESKKSYIRALWLYKKAKSLPTFDASFSFRNRLYPKLLQLFLNSKQKFIYKRYTKKSRHQAKRYNDFINRSLKKELSCGKLKLYIDKHNYNRPTLGINPGATYGSAKRWYPDRFADVATKLSSKYDIVIFGGPNEVEIAKDIEDILKQNSITNFQNLAGKTTIEELISHIAGVELFITNDSGPMHIAAAYGVKTVALFGPTKDDETSPWNNPNAKIIKHDLECAPCMKRVCPLKTHECMKLITAKEVISFSSY